MKKKILLAIAIVAALTCLFAISVSAKTFTEAQDGLTYYFNDSNLTAQVTNANQSYASEILIIPENVVASDGKTYTVTQLNDKAFQNNKIIKYVSLPPSIKVVKTIAFNNCTSLVFVDFGDNNNKVEFQGYGTFYGCTSLKAVSLPKGANLIPERCFKDCSALEVLYLGESIVSMGSNADNEGCFHGCSNMYFVQNAFSVRNADGSFYTAEEWAQAKPSKPTIYYFPETLTTIKGHVEKDFGYGTGATIYGSFFKNCTNVNDVLVFGENFKYISTPNMFHSMGTESSPKTVVFLADIQGAVTLTNAKYINIVFANKADKSPADLGLVNVYANYNNDESYMYFCATGNKYTYGLPLSELDYNKNNKYDQGQDNTNQKYTTAYNETYSVEYDAAIAAGNDETTAKAIATELATAAAKAVEAEWIALAISAEKNPAVKGTMHVHDASKNAYKEATCTTAEGDYTFCFCGAELSFVKAENGDDALGHIYTNIIEKIFPTIEGGSIDYYADATYVYACPQCETNVNRLEKGTSLFTKSGFSANEEDMTDVVFIVYINYANIEAYLAENEGVELSYGLVASANTTGKPLSYADGKVEAASNTVKVDMTGLAYNKLTMRITNVGDNSLHCAGYVSYNGEISYLNHETTNEEAAIVSLSIINDMLFPSEDEGAGEGEETPAV